MKCIQCGYEIPDGSKFCNSCGAKVEIEIPKENQAEQRSTGVKKFLKEKKEWVIGYAVWFVMFIKSKTQFNLKSCGVS